MNEIEKFFGGLPGEDKQAQDVFDQENQKAAEKAGVAPEKGDGDDKGEGEEGEPRKNRRQRRLEEKMKQKDEMLIALNERVKVLSEVRNGEPVAAGEMPPEWVALYGNTDESKNAWAMQSRIFGSMKEQAKIEAVQELERRQQAAIEEQKQYESHIDSELEALEDEYDVDLTSNAPAARKARREFLEMVQSLSPKDESGTLTGYADFESTFEIYQRTKAQAKPEDRVISRQKEIAAKTMQESNNSSSGNRPTFTPGFRGWQTDYNLPG